MPSDLRTQAIILRRTNYGESDRILNLLTPSGKFSVLARGARKEKSRLAGGIELFSVSDVTIHQGRSALATLTGAKMIKFYGNILADLPRLELASSFLKSINRAAEQTENPDFFDIINQALAGLDRGYPLPLVSTWFAFNFARTTGEEINLIRDVHGEPLVSDQTYTWDSFEAALRPDANGPIGTSEIKLARLLLSSPLALVSRVQDVELSLPPITSIAQGVNHGESMV